MLLKDIDWSNPDFGLYKEGYVRFKDRYNDIKVPVQILRESIDSKYLIIYDPMKKMLYPVEKTKVSFK